MNRLIASNIITEMKCATNFAYILNDKEMFLPTQYKVVLSRSDDCFVKCMRMLYNGNIQLYYIPGTYRPLYQLIPSLDVSRFTTVINNLFQDIMAVKSNGFLSCQNIDITFERIYINPKTYKVRLVYLPLNQPLFEDYSLFENLLRTELIKVITNTAALLSPKMYQFADKLADGTSNLEELIHWLKSSENPSGAISLSNPLQSGERKGLCLVSLDMNNPIEIMVNKNEFLIGRKASIVDGVVEFNKMIGRVHCKINKTSKGFTLTDLNSANGTYVNQKRLTSNQEILIQDGDVIRLANSDFKVRIGY